MLLIPGYVGLTSSPINAGTYTVVANYAGDDNYSNSSSSPVTFVVDAATPVSGISVPRRASFSELPRLLFPARLPLPR